MAITDLTGTKWRFDGVLKSSLSANEAYFFDGKAYCNGDIFDVKGVRTYSGVGYICIGKVSELHPHSFQGLYGQLSDSKWYYQTGGPSTSVEADSFVVEIIGPAEGRLVDDTKQQSLIAWFEANATQIIDPPTGLYKFMDDIGLSHVFTKLKTKFEQLLNGKANKVPSATQYNVALFDEHGDLYDGGLSMADRATMRGWKDSETSWGTYIEQDQGGANQKSFGFMNSSAQNLLAWQMWADGGSVNKLIPTKDYVDSAIAKEATETTLGTIKLNPSKSITLDANGHLVVGGRIGQFPGTTGLFAPDDREPRNVGNYSFLITDAKGVDLNTNRAFALVSGLGVTCKSAAAGATEYRVTNNYANRIICKAAENGYISLSEAVSNAEQVKPVVSVTIDGQAFTPDSSANDSSKDIVIKVAETLNPDAATTSVRIFPIMKSYSTAHIGNGIASWGGGRNFLLGGGVIKDGSSNDDCLVGNGIYCSGNGNAAFGRHHIIRKNRGFFAGQGHDSTNASGEGVSAIGQYSYIDANTLFAVGNGSNHTARLNAFEVLKDGSIALRSPNGTRYKIAVSDSGAITATAI